MSTKHNHGHLDYDEETVKDKAKRGAGIFTLIGTGALAVLHTLSHIVPAIGVLGLSFGDRYPVFYKFVSNEYLQFAYIPFVALGFYYMYRDHQHHKHEAELRRENERLRELLKKKRK